MNNEKQGESEVKAKYYETETERILEFQLAGTTAVISQNRDGYAMLKVREGTSGDELERYYGFDIALDHVAELLDIRPNQLPVPPEADDMGM